MSNIGLYNVDRYTRHTNAVFLMVPGAVVAGRYMMGSDSCCIEQAVKITFQAQSDHWIWPCIGA